MAVIEIQPSTELISDEFDGSNPKAVHIFSGVGDSDTCKYLIEDLRKCIAESEISQHDMKTKKSVETALKKLTEADYSDKSCLLVFVLGRANIKGTKGVILPDSKDEYQPIYIQDVWSKFVLVNSLRKKPKIFVFQATAFEGSVSADSSKLGDSKFDIPVEADLFITLKNLQFEDGGKFIKSVGEQIAKRAERDDIIDIITSADNDYDYKIPTVISTLTRKFYFKMSNFRGNYWDIMTKLENVKRDVKQITDKFGSESNMKRARSEQSIPKSSSQNIPSSPKHRHSIVPSRSRANSKSGKTPQ